MAAIVPADHALVSRSGIKLADIQNELFFRFNEDQFPGRPQMLEHMFSYVFVTPQVVAKETGHSELLELVSAGRGIAFGPYLRN